MNSSSISTGLSNTSEVSKLDISGPAIAHLAQSFPSLTMTFVYREVMALRERGVRIDTFSIWPSRRDGVSEEARDLIDTTFYIFPLSWVRFLYTQFYFLLARPAKYLGTLFYLLTRPDMKLSHRQRTFFQFFYATYLALEIKKRGIRHIHAHFALNAATVAMVIGRLLDITYSMTAHANDIFADPVLLKEKLENARFVVTISEYNRRYLQRFISTTGKIHVVNYLLDLEKFKPLEERIKSDKPVIFSIGRLVEKKGFPYLIQACQILAERGYQFECLIVGDGPQKQMLQQMIIEANLENRITLVGAILQEDLPEYWKRAAIFVLPCVISQDGDRDGMPNVLIEAMALGVPVISTALVGIPEFIQHGRSGYLASPEDAGSLAGLMADLLDRPDLQERMSYNARLATEQNFSLQRIVGELLDLYEQYGLVNQDSRHRTLV